MYAKLSVLILLLASSVDATTVRGVVTLAGSTDPVPSANVLLIPVSESDTSIQGRICDERGEWTCELQPGSYEIQVRMLTYETWDSTIVVPESGELTVRSELIEQRGGSGSPPLAPSVEDPVGLREGLRGIHTLFFGYGGRWIKVDDPELIQCIRAQFEFEGIEVHLRPRYDQQVVFLADDHFARAWKREDSLEFWGLGPPFRGTVRIPPALEAAFQAYSDSSHLEIPGREMTRIESEYNRRRFPQCGKDDETSPNSAR